MSQTPDNWMVHLRDGGERIGINNASMRFNPDVDVYEFHDNTSGQLVYSFPMYRVKYIQRKIYGNSKTQND